LEIILGEVERFYSIQKLIDRSKNFRFGMLIIGTKAKHINLVRKYSYRKQIVFVLAQKFWHEAKQFDLVWKLSWAK
jgi:hypothetical protein